MSVKNYGIYLAYPPTVDIRDQGLGRHLAMFLKGAEQLTDVQFTIVCPSWSKETLDALFESEQVPSNIFRIIAPNGKPYVLRSFEFVKRIKNRPKGQSFVVRTALAVAGISQKLWDRWSGRAVTVHDGITLVSFLMELVLAMLFLIPAVIAITPLIAALFILKFASSIFYRIIGSTLGKWQSLLGRFRSLLAAPEQDAWVLRLYDLMQTEEVRRMNLKINNLKNIQAWYCPTAFWPSFHDIRAPRLMCVPDVVLTDFPAGFSAIGGNRFLSTFETIGLAIKASDHLVTYSEHIKWNTLIDRYGVSESRVTVIPHAPNSLRINVEVSNSTDSPFESLRYCHQLLREALKRSTNKNYTGGFDNLDMKFIFYASQFRPNKNILMLLRAFEFLLRKRFIGHKLLLTGHPAHMPDIQKFIDDHRLENDVIFMNGLSLSELAVCYKMADLAVNPTLSEGGCPFTFTEALSVGTPVLMSRIPVAEEILTDLHLQQLTFFDPFDWKDCANRIEWAIGHREELLKIQLEFYTKLEQRSWTQVVAEHVNILEKISQQLPGDEVHE